MCELRDKRNMIIKAAGDLFLRYGYAKTSLDDIAKEARVGKGTIYYYFADKQEVFLEIVQVHVEEFLTSLNSLLSAENSFEGKLRVFLMTPIRLLNDHVPLLTEALRDLSLQYQARIEGFRKENKQRLKDILREIVEYGFANAEINDTLPVENFIEIINDWFLMNDENIVVLQNEKLIEKIQRDHELIIKILLYGIVKRG